MSYRSELITNYFPDAPERCQFCPALAAAAQRLDNFYRVDSTLFEEGVRRGALEDEQTAEVASQVGTISSGMIESQTAALMPMAKELYDNCKDGTYTSNTERQVTIPEGSEFMSIFRIEASIRGRRVRTKEHRTFDTCTSSSPIAAFCGPHVFDYIPGMQRGPASDSSEAE